MSLAIAEHSMCHPGRPAPQGESQEGSPSLDFFHNAKSDGERLSACPTLKLPIIFWGNKIEQMYLFHHAGGVYLLLLPST